MKINGIEHWNNGNSYYNSYTTLIEDKRTVVTDCNIGSKNHRS